MFLVAFTLALADEPTCLACCTAGGAESCPTTLQVRTEKSGVDASGLGYDLQGVWVLRCDGSGRFDPTVALSLDHEPDYAEVLGSGQNPLAIHCFAQACALPEGVCVGPANQNGDVQLVACDDGLAVAQRALTAPPKPKTTGSAVVVVIDGRPLVAEKATGENTASKPVTTPAWNPPPPAAPAPAPTTDLGAWGPPPAWESAPGAAAPAWTPPPPPAAAPSPPPAAPAPVAAPVVLELPADPPDPCTPAIDTIRAEARKRVGTGDDFRMGGQTDLALRDYRAALTLDKCNAYAWMSLAQLANDAARTDLTVRALRNSTRLLPTHPGGWLMLGRAYEAIGQKALAAESYQKAVALAPGNAEAVEGYMRTR